MANMSEVILQKGLLYGKLPGMKEVGLEQL